MALSKDGNDFEVVEILNEFNFKGSNGIDSMYMKINYS